MACIEMVEGSTTPSLLYTLQQPNGTVIDVSNATVILRIRKRFEEGQVLSRQMVLVTPASGIVRHDWQGSDWAFDKLVGGQEYELEIMATWSDGSVGKTFALDRLITRKKIG